MMRAFVKPKHSPPASSASSASSARSASARAVRQQRSVRSRGVGGGGARDSGVAAGSGHPPVMARRRAYSTLEYPEHLNPFHESYDAAAAAAAAAATAAGAASPARVASAPNKGKFATLTHPKRRNSYSSAWNMFTLRKAKPVSDGLNASTRSEGGKVGGREGGREGRSVPPSPAARRKLFPDLSWLPLRRRPSITSVAGDTPGGGWTDARGRSSSVMGVSHTIPSDSVDPETFTIAPRRHRYREPSTITPEEEAKRVAERLYGPGAVSPKQSAEPRQSPSTPPVNGGPPAGSSWARTNGFAADDEDSYSEARFVDEVRRYVFPPSSPAAARPQTAAGRLVLERLYIEEPEVEVRRRSLTTPAHSPVNGEAATSHGTQTSGPRRPPRSTKKRRAPPPPPLLRPQTPTAASSPETPAQATPLSSPGKPDADTPEPAGSPVTPAPLSSPEKLAVLCRAVQVPEASSPETPTPTTPTQLERSITSAVTPTQLKTLATLPLSQAAEDTVPPELQASTPLSTHEETVFRQDSTPEADQGPNENMDGPVKATPPTPTPTPEGTPPPTRPQGQTASLDADAAEDDAQVPPPPAAGESPGAKPKEGVNRGEYPDSDAPKAKPRTKLNVLRV